MKKKDNLLIIHQGALGDFVLILPFISILKDKYIVDIFCSPQNAVIAEQLEIADKVFSVEAYPFYSLFCSEPDPAIIQLLNGYNNILLFSFSKELSHILKSITKSKVFLIYPRPKPTKRLHITEYIKYQLQLFGFIKQNRVNFKLKDCIYNPGGVTFIHPGAGSIRKRWDLSCFLDLYEMLEKENIKVEFLLGPAEEDIYPLVSRIVSYNRVHFIQDMALLLKLLKTARGVIGNDSGVVHLSAFLGIPTVAIFGPSDPIRWRPIGNKVAVIRQKLSCVPCFEIKKSNCANPLCLDISPDIVFQKYKQLIS